MTTESRVTTHGIEGARPDRDATVGVNIERPRRRRAEQPMVPDATFTSYYGRPVLKEPTWKAPEIAGYFFCGGLAGTASVVAAAADLTHRPALARAAKVGAAGAISAGMVGLVHDLGKPSRFVNMLRVFKPTSPMSVGSWLLAAYTPAAGVAAATAITHRYRAFGALATASAAVLGPAVATYTGALVSDTAIPAWHDAHREMPFVFGASAMAAGAGWSLLTAPVDEAGPVRRVAVVAAAGDVIGAKLIERRLGFDAEPYHTGTAGTLLRAAHALTIGGALTAAVAGRRSRVASRLAGTALLAGSVCTKFGVFYAGRESARDPQYTIRPQRERVDALPAVLNDSASTLGSPAHRRG